MAGYLTPDSPAPTTFVYRRCRIPNDERFIANVSGALLVLSDADNWTPQGTMDTDTAAALAGVMVDEFMTGGDWAMLGSIFPFASAVVPAHCLECDGSTLLRVDYTSLYAVLDAAFIIDADHFSVPDMRQRIPIGSDFGSGTTYQVGDTGGEATHTLTLAETASHTHTDTGHTHLESGASSAEIPAGLEAVVPSAFAIPAVTSTGFASITSEGGDGAHNNLQPYLALRYAMIAE